jgi:hypothetical protein
MIQRIALFVASLAAVAALVVGMSVAGLSPSAPVASAGVPIEVAAVADQAPQVQIDTVYVAPPQKPTTVVVHKSVPAAGGGHESESGGEGGGD